MGKKWSRPVRWFLFFAGLILVYQLACHMPFLVDAVCRFFRIVSPFLVGFVLAYLLQIPCIKVEQRFQASSKKFLKKRARTLSVWTVVVGLILILAAMVSIVAPGVMKGIQGVIDALPEYYGQVKKWVQAINNSRLLDFQIDLDALLGRVSFEEKIQSIMKSENAAAYAQGLVGASMVIVNAVLAFITAIYILLYRRQLKRMAVMLLDLAMPKKHQELLIRYMGKIHEYFAKFVLCQLLDAGILGAVMTVIFYLAGVEYAALLGPLVGVGNLIPCFGAIIAGGVAVLVILLTDGVSAAVIAGILLIAAQQIDGNIVQPKLLSGSLKLNPLLVIIAITVGGAYFGLLGMLLAIPVAALLKTIVLDLIQYKHDKKISSIKDGLEITQSHDKG